MTCTGADFMPTDRQLFPQRIANALSSLLRAKHPTAKHMARAYQIDPSTAENVSKGHLSIPTLEKVVAVEGMGLWIALGEELTGQTYDQHLENRIEETRRAHERLARRRDRVRDLEARAFQLGGLGDGLGS